MQVITMLLGYWMVVSIFGNTLFYSVLVTCSYYSNKYKLHATKPKQMKL